MHIDVRENRERENDVKLHAAAVRYREVANPVRVVLRAVTIEVNEVRARVREATLLDHRAIDVDAPVVFMVHLVARAREKSPDIPAEIKDLAPFPNRMTEHFIEIGELSQTRRDEIPGERATVSEERLSGVDE